MTKKNICALALSLTVALALTGCAQTETDAQSEGPTGVAVQINTIERQDVATESRVSGTVTIVMIHI